MLSHGIAENDLTSERQVGQVNGGCSRNTGGDERTSVRKIKAIKDSKLINDARGKKKEVIKSSHQRDTSKIRSDYRGNGGNSPFKAAPSES